MRAGRKKRRSLSPTVQEVCEDCKSGRARESQAWNRVPGMERLGGGSGVPRLRTFCGGQARVRREVTTKASGCFCARLAKAARLTTAVRAASAISARQSDSDQPMRRNQRVLNAPRYSTTSSAAACRASGTVRPTACAVPRHRYAPGQFSARSHFNVLG